MKVALILLFGLLCVGAGYLVSYAVQNQDSPFPLPLVSQQTPPPKPLLAYSIPNLQQRTFNSSQIVLERQLNQTPTYTSYLFSYQTLNRRMTGVLNLPTRLPTTDPVPTIVMLRGYVPAEQYESGVGTKNAAAAFAAEGYMTVAPDFFGYGESDPEPSDIWQARFEKPVAVIELIRTLQTKSLNIPDLENNAAPSLQATNSYQIGPIGIWAHSNGGQIALTTLEILGESIPTTLWAPVTAPFPYSILFFSDENTDEGKSARLSVSQFEEDYDVFDFSLTQHLSRLTGPLQLHHGQADEAALPSWSTEFIDKIELENENRQAQTTPSASIELSYYPYPGADHNLQPGWATAIARDLAFFGDNLQVRP
jgi:cephalosporin-C deacetylase-like acetyl esterase